MESVRKHNGSRHALALVGLALTAFLSCRNVDPKPPVPGGYDDSLAVGNSFVTAPIIFEIAELEEKINKALPMVLVDNDNLKTGKKGTIAIRIERSGPVRLAFDGKQLSFGAPIQVYLGNPIRIGKKKEPRRPFCAMQVDFKSPLTVQDDWRVRTEVEFLRYRWLKRPAVRVLGINISVRRFVEKILKKREDGIEVAIDRAIHDELRLDREVLKIWRDMQKPLLVNRRVENVWLHPVPYRITVAPIYGNRETIVVPTRVHLKIDTEFGPRPVYAVNSTLPPLNRVDTLPLVCDLHLLSKVSYDYLDRVLARTVNNHEFEYATRKLKIRQATVYGSQRSVIVQADVEGAVSGTLYLRGKPLYDTLSHTLKVRGIDYDIKTEEILFRTANWLLHDTLQATMQNALTIPLKHRVARIPGKIETAFNRGKPGRKARIHIGRFRFVPSAIAVRPEGLHVLVHAQATMALRVTDL
ncbi:DUF4403 family protein [Larkinella soli]|uniref:DUF4403 family protein n=1 Tax=Larkinella soli TaxID=1770527 RepID=UPI000FFB42C3|nr:DUF4403 family protein [Larkinella soli]